MSVIRFDNVSYRYPDDENFVIENLSLEIPSGITAIIGQNGTGKSTTLLLAAGVVTAEIGEVSILEKNTKEFTSFEERQQLVSFIFQNMEFESEDSVIDLLNQVYENGFLAGTCKNLVKELVDTLELKPILARKTQEISKGELQRVIIAFSLLYGSKILIMDEPIFAMEEYQKERVMKFLTEYVNKNKLSLIYTEHKLDICQRYSENLIVFYKDKKPIIGATKKLFTEATLEEAYNSPYAMLKQKETLYRDILEDKKGHITNK